MSEKKFTVRPGDEVVIKIPKKNSDLRFSRKSENPPAAKAMLPARRASDVLPRRLQKGGLLNIYDVALKKNESGDFVDWFTPVAPAITNDTFLIFLQPSVAEFQTLQNQFLSVPGEDWKTTYKRITPDDAALYDLALTINDETETVFDETNGKWSSAGLKTKAVSDIAFKNYSAFFYIDTKLSTYFKITQNADYDASEVALNLRDGADIFLLPTIARHFAVATGAVGSETPHLDYIWLPFRRDLHKESGFFRRDTTLDLPTVLSSPALANQTLDVMRNLPNARAFTKNNSSGAITPTPTSSFPVAVSPSAVEVTIQISAGGTHSKALLAVINAPDKTFYIWRRNSLTLDKTQQFLIR